MKAVRAVSEVVIALVRGICCNKRLKVDAVVRKNRQL